MKQNKVKYNKTASAFMLLFLTTLLLASCGDYVHWSGDTSINGIWVTPDEEIQFKNGKWQSSLPDGMPIAKGIFNTGTDGREKIINIYTTHFHGASSFFQGLTFSSRWYSIDELKSALIPLEMTEEEFYTHFGANQSELFLGKFIEISKYLVNEDTLTVKGLTFSKK